MMAKQDIQVKAIYYVGCACLYVLTRYLDIVPRDSSLLVGGIILSWTISLPLTVCAKTLRKRHRSTFNDLPGPQVRANI